jgi:8-oxo-dGTP pyrophosphatase MutT (NUDIX family)
VVNGVHQLLLRMWGHVPRTVRRWIVRVAAPSFTVGAACVIERGDGSILLVRLSYRRGWGLPGGLIQRREDVAVCARREVGEEVGLDVEVVGAPAVVVDSRPQRVDVVFRARPAVGADADAARPTSPEIVDVRWFPAGELPALQHEAVAALGALAASALGDETPPARTSVPAAAGPSDDAAVDSLTSAGADGDRPPGHRRGARHADGASPSGLANDEVLRMAAAQAALQRSPAAE